MEQCKHLPLGETPFSPIELGFSAFRLDQICFTRFLKQGTMFEKKKCCFCFNQCSLHRDRTIGDSRGGAPHLCQSSDTPSQTWMNWGKVARDGRHQPALDTPFHPWESFFFHSYLFHFWLKLAVDEWSNYSEGVLCASLWTVTLLCFSSSADVFDPEFATHCMYLWNFCSCASS